MFSIDRMTERERAFFLSRGIEESQWRLFARYDRDGRGGPAEGGLLLTGEQLYIARTDGAESEGAPVPMAERSLVALSTATLGRLSLEEQISSCRLLATDAMGEVRVLCELTNFCKSSVLLFIKYTERFLATGEILPEERDLTDDRCCPTCGLRYPDGGRKLCPHCMKRGETFLRILSFIGKYRWSVLLMVLSLVVLSVTGILAPYFSSGFYYDEVISTTGRFAGNLLLVLFLVVGARVFKLLATILNDLVTSVIAARMVFDLKKTIFSSIQRLSLRFFTGRQTGRLMTQINEDATTIYEFFCDGVPYIIVHSVQSVVLLVVLFTIEPILAAASLLLCAAYMLLLIRWIFRNGKKLSARRFAASGRLQSFLADVFSGVRVVKAFAREDAERERFAVRNETLAAGDRRHQLFNNDSWPVAHTLLAVGTALVWGVGGYFVITERQGLTYGMLLTFVTYLGMLFTSLRAFAEKIGGTAECSNALSRLFEIMDTRPEIEERPDALEGDVPSGSVEFQRVSFSYEKGRKIIDDVSFSIPDGGVIGIVGHTGAGKSTLANLLMRLYDVDEGEVRIGGIPVKDLSLRTLYRSVAIVSQETYLFIGSIAENIAYACPEATREEIIHAAKCAGAHEFIMSFPDGYDTRIGVGIKDLSGGERQRISIARAILKNPRILILDEATSAMDTATERRIQEALAGLIEGRTTIMIAHRLSTLRDADRLLVIEGGRVVESGTHTSLLANESGVYHRLYTLQMEALRNAGISE